MAEHKTTIGKYETPQKRWSGDGFYDASADDPVCPGEGWKLVGSSAADGLLFWFWEKQDGAETG